MEKNEFLEVRYEVSSDLLHDLSAIIDEARQKAYTAVNIVVLQRNWLLGKRIAEEELKGEDRAKYGAKIIEELSKELTLSFGKGFTKSNLYQFALFYKEFPSIFHTVSGNSSVLLSWSHYRTLLQVDDDAARNWYLKEAAEQTWSVRTLQRNISSQYFLNEKAVA